MVLNHVISVASEKCFPQQADNIRMFVETDFDVAIGSWFRYWHRYVCKYDSDNTFVSVSIVAESILKY